MSEFRLMKQHEGSPKAFDQNLWFTQEMTIPPNSGSPAERLLGNKMNTGLYLPPFFSLLLLQFFLLLSMLHQLLLKQKQWNFCTYVCIIKHWIYWGKGKEVHCIVFVTRRKKQNGWKSVIYLLHLFRIFKMSI